MTHDNVVREIAAFCRAFGLRTRVEETHVFNGTDPNTNKRPDISIQAGQVDARKTIVDVSITAPIQKALRGIIQAKGKQVQKVYNDKVNKYQQKADQNNLYLVPLVMYSTGSMHKTSLEFLKKVAGVKINGGADQEGGGYSATEGLYKYMMTKIGMVLQKSLANAFIMGRMKLHGGNVVDIPSVHDEYGVEAVLDYVDCLYRNGMNAM